MNKDIIVFGNTEYSYMIAKYIEELNGNKIIAFTVDKQYIDKPYLHELPVIPFENIENQSAIENVEFIIGVGYKSMNSVREKIYNILKKKNYQVGSFIHPKAIIETNNIGEGNIVLSGAYIGKNVEIGNANIFWNNCNISHDISIGDFNYFAPSSTFGGFVNIKNNCFFGLNCIVKNGISVSSSSLIGAGAYLDVDTDPFDVYVPPRSLKLKYKSVDMNI